jgi:hypothetical protein
LLQATLGGGVFIAVLDAMLKSFDTPPTFFPFLGIIAGGITGAAAYKNMKTNGKDDGDA